MIEFHQKGVTMLVSAISTCEHNCFTNNAVPFYYNKKTDPIADTSFNSLTPYNSRRAANKETLAKIYNNINEWKGFCHNQVLGEKLNIIA